MSIPEIIDVYAVFEALTECARAHFNGELGGKLVLYALLDEAGSVTAMAANIAGAASLGLDLDDERLKQAVRNGVCDFVVNGLDEALRILKNEIRKKQPVAVGLVGDVTAYTSAIVERGVQPDLLAFTSGGKLPEMETNLAVLMERGARSLSHQMSLLDRCPSKGDSRTLALKGVRWSVADSPARWLPRIDALAVAVIANGGEVDDRLRWLRVAPRYFPRAPYHFVKMTSRETEQFEELVREQSVGGSIAAAVNVERMGIAGLGPGEKSD